MQTKSKDDNTILFPVGNCTECGARNTILVYSLNPLNTRPTICYNCVAKKLDYNNLEDADFFCRTYNFPFLADLWLDLVKHYSGAEVFRRYSETILAQLRDQASSSKSKPTIMNRIPDHYIGTTADLWKTANTEWQKCRSYYSLMTRLEPIREGYVERAQQRWGEQYDFQQLLHLDSIYTKTLQANNIVSPLQKEAVKTLCKLQIEMDVAIKGGDTKSMKDLSSSWSTYAKQANLDNMIAETKTSDITTMAALADYLEKTGFVPHFYDGYSRDEVDQAMNDISEANRKFVVESTTLGPTLEDMMRRKQQQMENDKTKEATSDVSIDDLLRFNGDEISDTPDSSDDDVSSTDFAAETGDDPDLFSGTSITTVSHKEAKQFDSALKTSNAATPPEED